MRGAKGRMVVVMMIMKLWSWHEQRRRILMMMMRRNVMMRVMRRRRAPSGKGATAAGFAVGGASSGPYSGSRRIRWSTCLPSGTAPLADCSQILGSWDPGAVDRAQAHIAGPDPQSGCSLGREQGSAPPCTCGAWHRRAGSVVVLRRCCL